MSQFSKLETVSAIAAAFVSIDADRSMVLHQFMRLMGDAPTYESWESGRVQWIAGYRTKKVDAKDEACNVAWSRFVSCVRQYVTENGFDFTVPEKPKSTSPAATKKAEQRANPFKDADKAAVLKACDESRDDKTSEGTARYTAALTRLAAIVKDEKRTKDKAEREATKGRRESISRYLRDCPTDVLALFESLKDATSRDDVKAWGTLAMIAKQNIDNAKKTKPTKTDVKKAA